MVIRFFLLLACFAGIAANATTITNGSFETGDFTGWATQDLAIPFDLLSVRGTGDLTGFDGFLGSFLVAPSDGDFAAVHGFDGEGPGTIRIGQDISVTADGALISFDYRAGWDLVNFCGGCQARLFDVSVEEAGGGALLDSFNFITALGGTQEVDSGILTGVVDLSDYIGQTIRLSFDAFIPESFTGPAALQLDNVQVLATPEPGILFLIGAGLIGLARARR